MPSARPATLDLPATRTREEGEAGLETACMARFRDRRGSADFQALYDLASPPLLAWITGQVRSRRVALDPIELLQDVFVNIYRYARGFREEQPASFRVWSRRIATNVVRRACLPTSALGSLQALPQGFQEPADLALDPGDSASGVEEMRSLARAWMILLAHYAAAAATLRDRERRALELIEIRDFSYAQAAADLGVGPSNMKMIVFRARKRIRAEIARRLGSASAPVRRRIAV
jgi:RNA polymerase sigma factor (sigma-70 family)